MKTLAGKLVGVGLVAALASGGAAAAHTFAPIKSSSELTPEQLVPVEETTTLLPTTTEPTVPASTPSEPNDDLGDGNSTDDADQKDAVDKYLKKKHPEKSGESKSAKDWAHAKNKARKEAHLKEKAEKKRLKEEWAKEKAAKKAAKKAEKDSSTSTTAAPDPKPEPTHETTP